MRLARIYIDKIHVHIYDCWPLPGLENYWLLEEYG